MIPSFMGREVRTTARRGAVRQALVANRPYLCRSHRSTPHVYKCCIVKKPLLLYDKAGNRLREFALSGQRESGVKGLCNIEGLQGTNVAVTYSLILLG